jgi:hypothetical protein
MPAINIFVLAVIGGGMLAFMVVMAYYSADSRKLPRDRR